MARAVLPVVRPVALSLGGPDTPQREAVSRTSQRIPGFAQP